MAGILTERFVLSAKEAGRYSDGANLYLNVSPTGKKSWIFNYRFGSKRREAGLGSYPVISIAKARRAAFTMSEQIAEGIDPLEVKRAAGRVSSENGGVNFKKYADEYLEGKKSGFRNAKHFAQWQMTINVYAKALHDLPVGQIKTENVLAVLKPIWLTIPETASRLRGRIEMIMNAAQSLGLIAEDRPNPARWKGHLENLLSKQEKSQKHHDALPYKEMPAFIAELRQRQATAALALEFAILAGGRTGEIIGAQWSEFDLTEKLWVVPAGRMKAKREHRVPLSSRALAILEILKPFKINDFVFIAQRDRPLSNMAMLQLLKRMDRNGEEARKTGKHITTHGMRSAFRDWCGDLTGFSREVVEAALSHSVGDKAEQAYRRGDALDKRRLLMQSWCDYCEGTVSVNLVHMRSVV